MKNGKLKFSTVAEGFAKIKEEYINGEVTEGEFADYLVLNYSEYFDSSIEPVVAIQAIQEFRQWDYEMEGEDAIKTFGGTEALSDNGYYGFIFMRNGQSMQLPDGVRVGIQTEDGGIALDEGIVACFKETKCFNANDYTTHQLIEMEFDNLPDSEYKDNMIDEALQLVEECGYTVGEAANEVLAKNTSFVGLPELFSIRETFLTYVGEWANCKECRTGENRANGSVTYLMDGLYLYEFKTREDAFKYLYDDNRSVPYAMAEYDERASEERGEECYGHFDFYNGFTKNDKKTQLLSLIFNMSVNGVNLIDISKEKNFEDIVDPHDATFQIFTQDGIITVDWGEGESGIDVYADSSVNEELVKAFRYQMFPFLTMDQVFDYFQSKK